MKEHQTDTAILIQARLGSTRFPEKILQPIEGVTMLESVFRRCQSTSLPTYIITTATDGYRLGMRVGMLGGNVVSHIRSAALPEDDVLGRYRVIADQLELRHIIRVTADCPLVDPDLILELLAEYRERRVLMAGLRISNLNAPGVNCYPDGLDAEIFSIDLLRVMDRALPRSPVRSMYPRGKSEAWREHVTAWVWNSEEFWGADAVYRKHPTDDHFGMKWSVDTETELEHVRTLAKRAPQGRWMDFVRVEKELRDR